MNRVAPGVLMALLAFGCTGRDGAQAVAELAALRAEVRALGDSAERRFRSDSLAAVIPGDSTSSIAVGLDIAALREILSIAAAEYLDEVRLHLRLNAIVRAGDEVRARIGPVNAFAGRWSLIVTVQRVDALLRAGAIDIVAADSNRLDLTIPVHVSDATGGALIDFKWDAATLASVVCRDFAIRERFAGYIRPRTYQLRGHFEIVTEGGGMVAQPAVRDRISVSPQPTEESWERVREILRSQDRIFKCGLALSPEKMESMLRELLTEGFRFSLPESILRPIALPGSVLNEVEVEGRRVRIAVVPAPPRLAGERLWLRAAVSAAAFDDEPIRFQTD